MIVGRLQSGSLFGIEYLFVPIGAVVGIAYLLLAIMIRHFISLAVVMSLVLTGFVAIGAIAIGIVAHDDRVSNGEGYAAFITAVVQAWLLAELYRCFLGIRFAEGEAQEGFVPNLMNKTASPLPVIPISNRPADEQ